MSTVGMRVPAFLLAPQLVAYTLEKLQVGLVTELCVGFLFAQQLMYTVRYYRLYGGPKGDSRLLRGYVALSLVLGLNFAAANTALAWTSISEVVAQGFVNPLAVTGVTVWWVWSLAIFGPLATIYWVWRACRVSRQRWVRIVAIIGWVSAITGFLVFAGLMSSLHWGHVYTIKQLQTCALVAGTVDGLWCGGVLMYELVWKRRASLAKSSVVNAFTAVALKTSALTCLVALAAAICITISFRNVDTAAFHAFLFVVSCLPFSSSSCAIFTLIHRNTLRDSLDRASGPVTPAVTPALRDQDAAARRRTPHLDSDGLLYTEGAPTQEAKRDSADADSYSREERAADVGEQRVLTLPTPLSLLPWGCGSGGEQGRARKKARRQSEAEERASRTSGISVVVDVVVTEEQCLEPLAYTAEDDFSVEGDIGSSGSQSSGSPKSRPDQLGA
ncbi:hypothetical protein JCM8208_003490 [Rhodotorula glutinis]